MSGPPAGGSGDAPPIDWQGWLRGWDAQQEAYLPRREDRFTVMLDVVEALLPDAVRDIGPDTSQGEGLTLVDLACGPGSLAQRALARFPSARVVAVDVDPVLLAIGRGALGDQRGRLRWVNADLRVPGWTAALDGERIAAVLTTTALHWLPPADLLRVYRDVAGLLPPGGLLVNGDHLGFPPSQPALRAAAARIRERRRMRTLSGEAEAGPTWSDWWSAVAQEPALADLVERRRHLDHEATHGPHAPPAVFHEAALATAGFREVGTVWQDIDDRVVVAVR